MFYDKQVRKYVRKEMDFDNFNREMRNILHTKCQYFNRYRHLLNFCFAREIFANIMELRHYILNYILNGKWLKYNQKCNKLRAVFVGFCFLLHHLSRLMYPYALQFTFFPLLFHLFSSIHIYLRNFFLLFFFCYQGKQ